MIVINYRSLVSCCQDFFRSTLQGSLAAFLFSIQPVKLDPRMFYVCGVPGFLTNDFNARFFEVPCRQFFDQRNNLVECQPVFGLDKEQTFGLAMELLNLTFSTEGGEVDHFCVLAFFFMAY